MSGAISLRVLGQMGTVDDVAAASSLRTFRQFLLLYASVRSFLWIAYAETDAGLLTACACVIWFGLAQSFSAKWAWLAPRIVLPVLLVQFAWRAPHVANHHVVEFLSFTMLALLGARERRDATSVLQGLRWLTMIVLFWAGLQKLLYGHYFRGDFLALMIAIQEPFAVFFRMLVSPEEISRVAGYDLWRTGSGPFRLESPLFALASNAVWVGEMGFPLLALLSRVRHLAALGAIALVLAIEMAALEIGFALLFLHLLMLFFDAKVARRLFPFVALFLVYALLATADSIPGDPRLWKLR